MTSLTCYSIRQRVGGDSVADFDAVVDFDRPLTADLVEYGPQDFPGFSCKLYVSTSLPLEPRWVSFLRPAFSEELNLMRAPAPGALLVVQIEVDQRGRYFAFTFGSGRFLLRNDSYERQFGLRTALSIIYGSEESEELDPSRVRAVDARRVRENTLRTRHQVSRLAPLEALDVDVRRDLLDGITGIPLDGTRWGSKVSGRDSLSVSASVGFSELGDLCRDVLSSYETPDYERRFPWLTGLSVVRDPELRERLEVVVGEQLRAREIDELDLAPPDLIDWDAATGFRFHFERRGVQNVKRAELRLDHFVAALQNRGDLDSVDPQRLRSWTLDVVTDDLDLVHRWPVWQCLTGPILLEGKTYVLDSGEFFEVAAGFLDELNSTINTLPAAEIDLPTCHRDNTEKEYNESAAAPSGRLLMDSQLVRASRLTSTVELCDVLTDSGLLVHVKKTDDGSRGLSHLFSQGYVSAELLVLDSSFREAALKRIKKVHSELPPEEKGDVTGFTRFSTDQFPVEKHEVVFALIGRWSSSDSLADGLSFFSKVNLRRNVEDLTRMAFSSSIKQVEIVDPD